MGNRSAPRTWARGLVFPALVSLGAGSVSAHDLWLLAGQYRLEPSQTTRFFLNSGDVFPESLTLVGEHRVTAVVVHGPSEPQTISAFRVEGKSLSFELSPTTPGSFVVALATRPRRVRLKGEDFTDYLTENGLDAVAADREARGETDQAAVERYTKWAKAVVDVGDAPSESPAAWSEPVGHTIEIVPADNPNRVEAGGTLRMRVLFESEPLAGASVTGGKAGGESSEIRTVTDADGYATVSFTSPGRWFLRTIHLVRLEDDPEVTWESFWCTMTFEIRDPEQLDGSDAGPLLE